MIRDADCYRELFAPILPISSSQYNINKYLTCSHSPCTRTAVLAHVSCIRMIHVHERCDLCPCSLDTYRHRAHAVPVLFIYPGEMHTSSAVINHISRDIHRKCNNARRLDVVLTCTHWSMLHVPGRRTVYRKRRWTYWCCSAAAVCTCSSTTLPP